MRLLCDLGIAQKVRLGERIVYEHLHLQHHHDHMICIRCGRITEFENPRIEQEQLAACEQAGFRPLLHRLEIRGLCNDCAASLPPTQPLVSCLPGEDVEIAQVLGGKGMSHRLYAMGLVPGAKVRLLAAEGPVAIQLGNSRVALGRGQAARVIVHRPVRES